MHITGTNGKGTVATQCASILTNAGYKTGLMMSPHLFDFCERFQINFQKVSKDYVAENIPIIKEIIEKQDIAMSYSLLVAALGFKYFRDQNIDIAVIEVGSGGTSDYTNIVEPEVAVITSVGLDHCDYFGNTVELIALEKSGVIKPSKPCIIGPNTPMELLKGIARDRNSEITCVEKGFGYVTAVEENSKITRGVCDILRTRGISISQINIEKGLKTRPPLRMQEILFQNKTIIFDVGHNPMAFERFFTDLKHIYGNRPIRFMLGYGKSRDPDKVLEIICKNVANLHLVSADDPVFHSFEALIDSAKKFDDHIIDDCGDIKEIMPKAMQKMTQNEIFVISGSFFIMEHARNSLILLGANIPIF